MNKLLLTTLLACLLTGCASMEPAATATTREEKQYVTGSNVPKKDRNTSAVTTVSKDAIDNMQNNTGAGAPAAGR